MIGFDYNGTAALIAAACAGIASILTTMNVRSSKAVQTQINTRADDPRTIGEIATDVANAVGAPAPKPEPDP